MGLWPPGKEDIKQHCVILKMKKIKYHTVETVFIEIYHACKRYLPKKYWLRDSKKFPKPIGEAYLSSLATSILWQIPLTSMVYFYNSTEYFPLNQTSTGFYSVAAHEIYNMISWTTRLYFANTRDHMHCSPYNVFFLLSQNIFLLLTIWS
jgi:hypothetical protein